MSYEEALIKSASYKVKDLSEVANRSIIQMSDHVAKAHSGEHEYWIEPSNRPYSAYVIFRKTKPKIGQVITYNKDKWIVWYVEEHLGHLRAKLEKHESLK